MRKIQQLIPPVRYEVKKPFKEKLRKARNIIKMFTFLEPKRCSVSCSFGKDSLAVLYLVREQVLDVPVIFCNTLIQHPETYKFKERLAEEWNLNIIETKPIKSFWKVAEEHGLDDGQKKMDFCCYYLKIKPYLDALKEHGIRINFTGVTAMESRIRMLSACQRGTEYYNKTESLVKVHPILFWTPDEVWRFLQENSIPTNPAYEKYQIPRIGCLPCTSHKGWKEQLAKINPKMYRLIQERYFKQPLLDVFYGEEKQEEGSG